MYKNVYLKTQNSKSKQLRNASGKYPPSLPLSPTSRLCAQKRVRLFSASSVVASLAASTTSKQFTSASLSGTSTTRHSASSTHLRRRKNMIRNAAERWEETDTKGLAHGG